MVLLLVACSPTVKVSNIDKSYTTETVTVDAKIPQISGLSDESLSEASGANAGFGIFRLRRSNAYGAVAGSNGHGSNGS